jgi:hypothetical protein
MRVTMRFMGNLTLAYGAFVGLGFALGYGLGAAGVTNLPGEVSLIWLLLTWAGAIQLAMDEGLIGRRFRRRVLSPDRTIAHATYVMGLADRRRMVSMVATGWGLLLHVAIEGAHRTLLTGSASFGEVSAVSLGMQGVVFYVLCEMQLPRRRGGAPSFAGEGPAKSPRGVDMGRGRRSPAP